MAANASPGIDERLCDLNDGAEPPVSRSPCIGAAIGGGQQRLMNGVERCGLVLSAQDRPGIEKNRFLISGPISRTRRTICSVFNRCRRWRRGRRGMIIPNQDEGDRHGPEDR